MTTGNSCFKAFHSKCKFAVIYLFTLSFFYLTASFLAHEAHAESPASFQQAKQLAQKLFSAKRQSLYCACYFSDQKDVDLKSCHMTEAASYERALRIEWEHMMPASQFGEDLACWQQPLCEKKGKTYRGRKCCRKIDREFRHRESELYNLWPAVGIINQIRSNYYYAEFEGEAKTLGCAIKIDKNRRQVEPASEAKGIVARASLFMADHYGIALSKAQRQLFEYWHALYPPTPWEKNWAASVAAIEGYENPYIN